MIVSSLKIKTYVFFIRRNFIIFVFLCLNQTALAQAIIPNIAHQETLTDTKDGPKEILRKYGIDTEIWTTQIYQGITSGEDGGVSRYGGKVDGFLKLTPEKIGILSGLNIDVQYEHYYGLNINRLDDALVPVNTAQAYLSAEGYHSALSITATQKFTDNLSLSVPYRMIA